MAQSDEGLGHESWAMPLVGATSYEIAAPLGSFRGKLLPYAVKGRTASEGNDSHM
jgi:hypothetical protein